MTHTQPSGALAEDPIAVLGAAAGVDLGIRGVEFGGAEPLFPSRRPVASAAAVAMGAAGAAAARFHSDRDGPDQGVRIGLDDAAAALLAFAYLRGDHSFARQPPPTIGVFQCADGRWLHLHGGLPHLHLGLLELLEVDHISDLEQGHLADSVQGWDSRDLEAAIAERSLCGVVVRSSQEWRGHPQGQALQDTPLVEIECIGDARPKSPVLGTRPLAGIKVLDLTRILAGPGCGRSLAAHGAKVLRVGAEHLPFVEPYVVTTGWGKRNAFCDLRRIDQRMQLEALLSEADVVVAGYRPGSLDEFGLDAAAVSERHPGIVYAQISCYGPGPWEQRKGWEQLAQAATGLMFEGDDVGVGEPRLLPAAFCDVTTGELAAFGVIEALRHRMNRGGSWSVEVSLCRTAMWLDDAGGHYDPAAAVGPLDPRGGWDETAWGSVWHLAPAVELGVTPPRWELPAAPLGTHRLEWW